MSFTFELPPESDRDELRIALGDTIQGDGPLPDLLNLDDELLDHWLEQGGSVWGAAALGCDHLAMKWIARPQFGPGELSTVHVDISRKFMQMAAEFRRRSDDPDVTGGPGAAWEVGVGALVLDGEDTCD